MIEHERDLHKRGYKNIAGLDEVGRGPLAGPVTVAAVILPIDAYIEDIQDSKQIPTSKRDLLYDYIIEKALAWSVVSISPKVIDQINVLAATKRAMKQAVRKLEITPDFLLLDAINIDCYEIPQQSLVKGDSRSYSIAAASIVAKVTRDRLMQKYNKKYPEYGFETHVGYGTKKHIQSIRQHGLSPIHRQSFCQKINKSSLPIVT